MTPEVRRWILLCRAHTLERALFATAFAAVCLFLLAMGLEGQLALAAFAAGALAAALLGAGLLALRRWRRRIEQIEEAYGLDGWPRVAPGP